MRHNAVKRKLARGETVFGAMLIEFATRGIGRLVAAAGYGSLFLKDVVAAREQGFRFLVYTADLWIFQRALRDGLEQIRGGA